MTVARSYTNECYRCIHRRNIPGNCHIKCVNPDPLMTGSRHGIANGWFIYPLVFDPIWKTRHCANFEWKEKEAT